MRRATGYFSRVALGDWPQEQVNGQGIAQATIPTLARDSSVLSRRSPWICPAVAAFGSRQII